MAVAAPPRPPERTPVDTDALDALIEEARRRTRRRRIGYAACALAALAGAAIFIGLRGGAGGTIGSLQDGSAPVASVATAQRGSSALIAVARFYRGERHILLIDPSGRSTPHDLGPGWDPSWSPDGKRLVFTDQIGRGGPGLTRIFVINADGSGRHELRTPSLPRRRFADWAPTWSVLGDRIAFTRTIWPRGAGNSGRGTPCCLGESAIYVLELVRGGLRRVSLLGNEDLPTSATWSPNGRRLAYLAPTQDSFQVGGLSVGCTGLRVTNADGTGDHVLPAASRLTNAHQPCFAIGAPAWSPDGRWIAFGRSTKAFGPGGSDLYLISANGTHLHRLTHQPDVINANPAWSADGSRVAFSSGRPSDSWGPGHGGEETIKTIVVVDWSGSHRHTVARLRGEIVGSPAW